MRPQPTTTQKNLQQKSLQTNTFLKEPQNLKRVNYDLVVNKIRARVLKNASKGATMPRISESSLRMELPIDPQSTVYRFNVLENQTAAGVPIFPEEIRLNLFDLFFITDIAFYVKVELTNDSGGVTVVSNDLLSYSPYELDKGFLPAMEHLYNGYLQVLVDNIVLIDKYDLMKHKYVPRTQFTTRKDAVAGVLGYLPNGYNGSTIPSVNFKENGFNAVQPMIELSGSKKNDLILNLPGAMSQFATSYAAYSNPLFVDAGVNGTIPITMKNVVCICRGMLVQNFSNFQHDKK